MYALDEEDYLSELPTAVTVIDQQRPRHHGEC
jgi:hypothetical protein